MGEMKNNQRKAMFAKMNALQKQQIRLLNTTPAHEVKAGNKAFINKESKLLIKSDKLTVKAIRKLKPEESLKVVMANDRIKDAFVRKAIKSGIRVNKKKLSNLK